MNGQSKDRWFRALLAGVGGQGVLLTSRVLCEGAMRAGLHVVSSEIRNMAQRGGSVSATVVTGGARSPVIPLGEADVVVGFEPMETARAARYMGKNTLVITNTRPVTPLTLSVRGRPYPPLDALLSQIRESCGELITIDATRAALEKGSLRALNMVMLGAMAARSAVPIENGILAGIVSEESPDGFRKINVSAFESGADLVGGWRRAGGAGRHNPGRGEI